MTQPDKPAPRYSLSEVRALLASMAQIGRGRLMLALAMLALASAVPGWRAYRMALADGLQARV